MYLDSSTVHRNNKSYTRHLLRECYREDGKIKHRSLANLSSCTPEEIQAIKLALKHKHDLSSLVDLRSSLTLRQGLSCGAVWTVHTVAKDLGIVQALGSSREGRLALWQVYARVIEQGSRLSAVRLAGAHAACDILGLDAFNEDDLYANLDWLTERQENVEDRLAAWISAGEEPGLYLYDVTSSYLEGEKNELGAFGYNRDGKKSKRQIVIGLLCNAQGIPISIEVFKGNTSDPKTVASQVRKVSERFGGGRLTLVGDRGMIRGPQIAELPEDFCYITAISKPQIESLLAEGVLQMSLFDYAVTEVFADDGIRYVLRRNPIRAEEIAVNRQEKLKALERVAAAGTAYLTEHPKAKTEVQRRALEAKAKKLKAASWASVVTEERVLSIRLDEVARNEAARFDGCYVIKTNLPASAASKETVHDRYKDLTLVEQAFRTSKTVELEIRPINVRLESRTRGHAFVVMLAYRIAQELARRWSQLDLTVQEGINRLSTITSQDVIIKGKVAYQTIPEPSQSNRQLLVAARITLPPVLPSRRVTVTTRKKLPSRRQSH